VQRLAEVEKQLREKRESVEAEKRVVEERQAHTDGLHKKESPPL